MEEHLPAFYNSFLPTVDVVKTAFGTKYITTLRGVGDARRKTVKVNTNRELLLQDHADLASGVAIVLERVGELFTLHVPTEPSVFDIEAFLNGYWSSVDMLLKDPQVICFINSVMQQKHGTWLDGTIIQDILSLESAGYYFPTGNTQTEISTAYTNALAARAEHYTKAQQQAVVDFETRLDMVSFLEFPTVLNMAPYTVPQAVIDAYTATGASRAAQQHDHDHRPGRDRSIHLRLTLEI
jgi:hypothetical protein